MTKRTRETGEEDTGEKRVKVEGDIETETIETAAEHPLEEETTTVVIQQEDVQQEEVAEEEVEPQMTMIIHEDGTEVPLEGVDDSVPTPEGALQIASEDGTVIVTEDHQVYSSDMGEYKVVAEDGVGEVEHVIEGQVGHMTTIDESQVQVSTVDGIVEQIPMEAHMETIQIPVATDGQIAVPEEQIDQSEIADIPQYQNIIIQHMDIAEPLTTLRKLLESRLQCSLAGHEFYLQDSIPLEPTKNLVSQCVQGSGMVQINVEVKSQPGSGMKPRLNIVDILKPAEEVEVPQPAPPPPQTTTQPATKVVIPFPEESENVTRWIVDQSFRKEQERLKIPFDPMQWNEAHVRHWIQWAVKEFSLDGVNIDNFKLSGRELCELRHEEFTQYIPNDKGDIFWTHLELLRKCKFVAVIQQPTPHAITTITVSTSDAASLNGRTPKTFSRHPRTRTIMLPSDRTSPGNRTGNNGQIQLWQFLLELLTDKDCREVIHWVGDDGEFKLNNPEVVAQMWGQRKNKPTMNYEKLSRALRYYYDGDMIAKVHGKRFVYKFVCDLRMLLGYSAGELNRLVCECAERKLQKVRESLRPTVKKIIERVA